MGNDIISVMLWGEEVGKLYWDERSKNQFSTITRTSSRKDWKSLH